jgi:hypothetical protein
MFAGAAELGDPADPCDAAMGDLNQAALAVVRGDHQRAAGLLGRAQRRWMAQGSCWTRTPSRSTGCTISHDQPG